MAHGVYEEAVVRAHMNVREATVIQSQLHSKGVGMPMQQQGIQSVAADAAVEAMSKTSEEYETAKYNSNPQKPNYYPEARGMSTPSCMRHEIAFVEPVDGDVSYGFAATHQPTMKVRTMCNGLTIAEAKRRKFGGIIGAPYNHAQYKAGDAKGSRAVSLNIFGYDTIVNAGHNTLRCGDYISFVAPPIYRQPKANGREDLVPLVNTDGIDGDKFQWIPKPVVLFSPASYLDTWMLHNVEKFNDRFVKPAGGEPLPSLAECLKLTDPARESWAESERPEGFKSLLTALEMITKAWRVLSERIPEVGRDRGKDGKDGKYASASDPRSRAAATPAVRADALLALAEGECLAETLRDVTIARKWIQNPYQTCKQAVNRAKVDAAAADNAFTVKMGPLFPTGADIKDPPTKMAPLVADTYAALATAMHMIPFVVTMTHAVCANEQRKVHALALSDSNPATRMEIFVLSVG